MKVLVTGGCGFIGSAVVKKLIRKGVSVLNIDKLTYAADKSALEPIENSGLYFERNFDICEEQKVYHTLNLFRPDVIVHLAAETHVDNSIESPEAFIHTNVNGTFSLLQAMRRIKQKKGLSPKLIHISTDEVFGDLGSSDKAFTEATHYNPSSPYSASKASADHLVSSWKRTFNFNTITVNCSNNFGAFQNKEKLIPKTIYNALNGLEIPIYGNGMQMRDWISVQDTAKALFNLITKTTVHDKYVIGANSPQANLDVVKLICKTLDKIAKNRTPPNLSYFSDLINFVTDRPGHDLCYRVNPQRYEAEFGSIVSAPFKDQLEKAVIEILSLKY